MDDTTGKTARRKPRRGVDNHLTPVVPREFVTTPFFPAKKQEKTRIVEFRGSTWEIGIAESNTGRKHRFVAIDMRHGLACLALLSFRDRLGKIEEHGIDFSINELAHRVAKSNGGRYSRDLVNLLYDLNDAWVRLTEPDGSWEEFRIVESLRVHGKPVKRAGAHLALRQSQDEFRFSFVHLNPKFFGLLKTYEELTRIRLDVMRDMTSDIARCLYAFLPSRAIHHPNGVTKFEIRLANLLRQVGMTEYQYRSQRKNIFTRKRNPESPSIMEQLDGAELVKGRLRVELAETSDGDDFKLLVWSEVPERRKVEPGPDRQGRKTLKATWLSTGRTEADFHRLVNNAQPLNDYQVETMIRGGVQVRSNEKFFEMTAALIGPSFNLIIAELKSDRLEGRSGKSQTKILISRLMAAVAGMDLHQPKR